MYTHKCKSKKKQNRTLFVYSAKRKIKLKQKHETDKKKPKQGNKSGRNNPLATRDKHSSILSSGRSYGLLFLRIAMPFPAWIALKQHFQNDCIRFIYNKYRGKAVILLHIPASFFLQKKQDASKKERPQTAKRLATAF